MTAQAARTRAGLVVGKRGTRTRELILEELTTQLRSKTPAEVSIIDVARGAGCSPASFYQYFEDAAAAAAVVAERLRAAKEPLPDGLVDQRARADALADALEKITVRVGRVCNFDAGGSAPPEDLRWALELDQLNTFVEQTVEGLEKKGIWP